MLHYLLILLLAVTVGSTAYAEAPQVNPAAAPANPAAAPANPAAAPANPAAAPANPEASSTTATVGTTTGSATNAEPSSPPSQISPTQATSPQSSDQVGASDSVGANQEDSTAPSTVSESAVENHDETPPPQENAELSDEEKEQRKSGIAKLLNKFNDKDGKSIPIGILTPLDYTTMNFADVATQSINSAIARYGQFDLRTIPYSPASLTLEEFRKVVIKFKVDVVLVTVLKPTNFDMFLYDRRTPYFVYAHSEILPEEVQYQLTRPLVEEYSKAIVRRTLYAYMQDQYFEIPRAELRPLLSAEIPRWIASARTLSVVNKEFLSNQYGSVSVGGALLEGTGTWSSNLIGIQLGRRLFGPFFVEGSVNMFAYNALMVSAKYVITNKESPFRFSVGLGLAKTSNSHTLNWDQKHTQGLGASYFVPSASLSFPVVEVHFKLETQLFIGPSKYVFSILPGLLVFF